MLKIALLGDAAVGKTSLRRRFMGKSFTNQHLMTIGADFSTTKLQISGTTVTYQLWDIAGEHSYNKLRSQFYKGVRGALCVFDITREESYHNLASWINELWQHNGDGEVPIILLGNKSDLRDDASISAENAQEYAKQIEQRMNKPFQVTYLDTSAKTGVNVDKAFQMLGEEILQYL